MFIRILEEQGCILVNKGEVYGSFNVRLTHQGWNLYRQGIVDERYGFLAMQFDDERIESFAHNMKFQLQKLLKVVLLDIRDFPEVGDLVEGENGIKSKIESSVFVVVDLTFANPGVYWEGGYAEGLGKHVVYTCRSEDDKDRRIHFNVEHQKCFFWGASCKTPRDLGPPVRGISRARRIVPGWACHRRFGARRIRRASASALAFSSTCGRFYPLVVSNEAGIALRSG